MPMQFTPKELVSALIESGMNQPEIKKETGIEQATISRIYTGKVEDTSSRNFLRLLRLTIERGLYTADEFLFAVGIDRRAKRRRKTDA